MLSDGRVVLGVRPEHLFRYAEDLKLRKAQDDRSKAAAKQFETPAQKYADTADQLKSLFAGGYINGDTFAEQLGKAQAAFDKSQEEMVANADEARIAISTGYDKQVAEATAAYPRMATELPSLVSPSTRASRANKTRARTSCAHVARLVPMA